MDLEREDDLLKPPGRQVKTRTRKHRPYRKTPTRLLAYHANLLKALEANRERSGRAGWSQDEREEHALIGQKEVPCRS